LEIQTEPRRASETEVHTVLGRKDITYTSGDIFPVALRKKERSDQPVETGAHA
jgi:hypothetical protein